jgi:hypothetical protein
MSKQSGNECVRIHLYTMSKQSGNDKCVRVHRYTMSKQSGDTGPFTRDTLVCSDDTIPLDGSNLVIKALDLFRDKTGVKQFFWAGANTRPHRSSS